MRRRLLPHPLMSAALVAVWLLLANDLSVGHLLLGAALGVLVPLATNAFWPERPRLARPGLALVLAARLIADIVVANLTVARSILSPRLALRPAFVRYPLELSDEFAVTVLASIISLTPGSVSAELSPDRRTLLVHALDLEDEARFIETIRQRYERPLREIFGC